MSLLILHRVAQPRHDPHPVLPLPLHHHPRLRLFVLPMPAWRGLCIRMQHTNRLDSIRKIGTYVRYSLFLCAAERRIQHDSGWLYEGTGREGNRVKAQAKR